MTFRSSCSWALRKICSVVASVKVFFHVETGLKHQNEMLKKYCDIFSFLEPAIHGRLEKSVLLLRQLTLTTSKI